MWWLLKHDAEGKRLTVNISDGQALDGRNDEDNSRATVVIEQLEDVHAALQAERDGKRYNCCN